MGKNQKEHFIQNNSDNNNIFLTLVFLITSLMVSSCGVVSGIFKAGMDFGIFIVIAILLVIVYFVMRIRKKTNK